MNIHPDDYHDSITHLPISPQIEEATARVIRSRSERVAGGVVLDAVDVGVVRVEGLHGLPRAHVPHQHGAVAAARHERVAHVRRRQVDRHHVGCVRLTNILYDLKFSDVLLLCGM